MHSMDTDPGPPLSPPAMEDTAQHAVMDRFAAVLDDALARNPESLATALRSDPIRTELQALLTRLDPARLLFALHRLATADLPDQREVLEALLAADPSGSGQALRARLQALHRQALLARIFHPDRVQVLRRACRPLAQEPA